MKAKILWLAVFLCCQAGTAAAQINPRNYLKPAELPAILKRPMIVALVEEDEKTIKKLTRKDAKDPGVLQHYKDEVAHFNAWMKSGLETYWHLNTPYEFKPMSEVEELMQQARKAKSGKYVVLTLAYLKSSNKTPLDPAEVAVPALFYTRAEKDVRRPDYKIYLPDPDLREDMQYSESDIHFALETMQRHLASMKGEKKPIIFDEYVDREAKKNCGRLKGKVLLVDEALVASKKGEAELKERYPGELHIVDHGEIDKAFAEKRENTAFMVCVPYRLLAQTNIIAIGPTHGPQNSFRVTGKVVIDCQTHDILATHEWVKNLMAMTGKDIKAGILARNLEKIQDCK